MRISVDLSTIPLSATTVSTAGTILWMSPELLFGKNSPSTRESDCYALGMVIYEVSWLHLSRWPPFTCHQVLTGLRPFHHLGPCAAVVAVQKGKHPRKPDNAGSLGFSDALWRLSTACWSKSPSARPTAQQLLRYLRDASHTWVPPLEYPIPESLDEGAGPDLTSSDVRSIAMGGLFFFMISMLCILVLPLT